MKIQWYEHVPGIFESVLVYRFYCGQIPQVQSHTKLMNGKIAMNKVFGTKDKRRSTKHKSKSVAEDENIAEWKLNGSKDFYNR